MSRFECRLFGEAHILRDGEDIFMPYVKASALLYYILVNKSASRDELAGLLWPEENNQTARKNLRNAIYRLHRAMGEEIISTPNKSQLMLSRDVQIECDVDRFNAAPEEQLALYQGEFLQSFSLKNASEYENWIMITRAALEKKFVASSYKRIEEDLEHERYDTVEETINRLMGIDEYDENGLRLLLRFYQQTGRNSKAIEAYSSFSRLIQRDLGIEPDAQTKQLYEQSLRQMNPERDDAAREELYFYGRYHELALMQRVIRDFCEHKAGKSLVISGEPGIGKAAFLARLLEEAGDGPRRVEIACYQEEASLSLRPWNALAHRLDALLREEAAEIPEGWEQLLSALFPRFDGAAYAAAERARTDAVHAMTAAIEALTQQRQLMLVLEDIQWMDADSFHLLTAVLQECEPLHVMALATCDLEYNRAAEDFIAALKRSRRLVQVPLQRFDYSVCCRFVKETMPGRADDGALLRRIYDETQGNPFFLKEYLELLHTESSETLNDTMREKLRTYFLYLSEEELAVLSAAALFPSEAPLDYLQMLTEKSREELLPLLTALGRRDLLHERVVDGESMIVFAHPKLREYAYEMQPRLQRVAGHRRIGRRLETLLSAGRRSGKICARLAYHYEGAGEPGKAFKYRLEALQSSFNIGHEMFPILSSSEERQEVRLSAAPGDEPEALFKKLEEQLRTLPAADMDARELSRLRIELFYLRGRYYFQKGAYDKGQRDIEYVISQAEREGLEGYVLNGYKQMSLCYLQINDSRNMEKYVGLALTAAARSNNLEETAICSRLQGLCALITGDYERAEDLMHFSIRILSSAEEMIERHAANIAAAYDYIGEIRLSQGSYTEAMRLFETAIRLCEKESLSASLTQFYIDAGRTCYASGDEDAARDYFERAYRLNSEYEPFWRRAMLEGYLALLAAKEQQFRRALQHLSAAQENANHIKSPSDFGMVCGVKAVLRRWMDADARMRKSFSRQLRDDAETYRAQALKNLNAFVDTCEIAQLEKIFK